jgi:hypothetical protein
MKEYIAEYIVPVEKKGNDYMFDFMNATSLIRCKDCAHFAGQPNGYCSLWSDDYLTKYRNAEDYCSDAER